MAARASLKKWQAVALLAGILLWTAPAAASADITAVEGANFSGQVHTFSEQCYNATSASGTITWGDGSTSAASVAIQVSNSNVATFTVSGSHAYARYGTYAASVTIDTSCGPAALTAQFTAAVSDAPLTAAGIPVSAVPGTAFTAAVAHLTDANPDGVASDDTATIDWGDGTVTAGSILAAAGGGFTVSGTHTYQNAGQDVISVSVTSSGGSHASANTTATVADSSSSTTTSTTSTTTSSTSTSTTSTSSSSPPPSTSTSSSTSTSASTAPPVRASFVTVGAPTAGSVVLDASASAPAGATASDYDWKLASAPGQDIVCPATEPQLQLNTVAATNTSLTLTTADARTGIATSFTRQMEIPAPARSFGRVAAATPLSHAGVSVTGVCAGHSNLTVPPLRGTGLAPTQRPGAINLGGAPPAGCDQDLVFGAADVHGCLSQIPSPQDIPGGIDLLLSKLLCGAQDKDFCLTAGAIVGTARVIGSVASVGTTLQQSKAVASATSALEQLTFPSYYSYTAIRLDGVDIVPQNGYPILILPAAKAIVAPLVRYYIDDHSITPVPVPLALYVPVTGGSLATITLPRSLPLIGSLPFDGSVSVTLNRAGATLSNGDTCQYACAALTVSAELPGVFSDDNGKGLSASGVVTADSVNGIQLDSLEVKVPSAQLAGIGVSDVDIRYSHANESLHAQATVNLFDAAGDISGSVDFLHGAFQAASVAWDAGDGPGIDLGGPLNIYLTHLGGSISLNPTTINATGTITGGPQYAGCALFGITGSMTATFGPFSFDANADGQFLCQNVSHEYFHIDDGGSILIGAQIDLNLLFLEFSGGLSIAGDIPQGHIQADANLSACINILGSHCLGAEVVVSDRGIGLCADLGFTHAGGGIQFPDTVLFFTHTCDIGKFRSLGFVTRAGRIAQGFAVPRRQAVTVIGVTGSDAAPRVTLHGPHGQTIDTPADGYEKTPQLVILADDKYTHETYFFLHDAPAGAWTITPDPGSAPITGIQQAAGLPSPDVHGTVRHAQAGRLELRYHLHPLAGQRVTFVERDSHQRIHTIAAARGADGSLSFMPSPLLGRQRTILAEVTQDGQPREDDVIARYAAPTPPPLPAPRGLRAKRVGELLRIRWAGVAGAQGYSVTLGLRDGTRRFAEVRHPQATIPQLPAGTGATVTVRALAPGLRPRLGEASSVGIASTKRSHTVKVRPV